MKYQYWILRYVPNAARGEFINVGIIVGGNHDDWAFKKVSRLTRASQLGGRTDGIREWIQRFESMATAQPDRFTDNSVGERSVGWLEELRARMNNTVQLSRPLPAQGDSATQVSEVLFATLVVDPVAKNYTADRRQLADRLNSAYLRRAELSRDSIRRRVSVHSGPQRMPFEFAVDKDDEIVQITQIWSFRRKIVTDVETDILASALGIQQLRKRGGTLVDSRGNRIADIGADVPVRVLFVPPNTDAQHRALATALDAWGSADIRSYHEGQENELAGELLG